jgi:hypothetical protein
MLFAINDVSWAVAYLLTSRFLFLGAKREFDNCCGDMSGQSICRVQLISRFCFLGAKREFDDYSRETSGSLVFTIQRNNDNALLSTEQHEQQRLSSVHLPSTAVYRNTKGST